MPRTKLPTRRPQIVLDVEHGGSTFTVGMGYFPDGGLGEIFVSTDKSGSDRDALLNDAAILVSRCLQFGDTLEGLAQSIGRHGDKTTPASALGAILDAAAKDGEL